MEIRIKAPAWVVSLFLPLSIFRPLLLPAHQAGASSEDPIVWLAPPLGMFEYNNPTLNTNPLLIHEPLI
jgi:hypothetical protein